MVDKITKIDGARRQIETAIELYFDNKDSLSVHTLAWAAFKVLFDLYPHHNSDGFDAQLDAILGKEGWQSMSGVANFLKHADSDPDAFLGASFDDGPVCHRPRHAAISPHCGGVHA
jgi:hypothetical protein